MQEQFPIRAAIDIGSNTIHIVVARCKPHDLEIIADQLEIVRIGQSVTATGAISPQKRDAAIATLCQYQILAQQHSAQQILVVATEAIRQASNSHEFLQHIKHQTGLHVYLISGIVEATLTFYGATYETPQASAKVGVMDLGGGSTELVTAKNMHISWRTSIPIGSGWLHDRYLPADPPTPGDLTVAHTFLHTYLQGVHIKEQPSTLIVTGGSANSLLHLARQAYRLNMQSNRLTYENLLHCQGLLSALTAEEISQHYGQPTARTRLLPAGALIMRAVMSRLNLTEISVSPHGIREGALLAYTRYGENWLERINEEIVSRRREGKTFTSRSFGGAGVPPLPGSGVSPEISFSFVSPPQAARQKDEPFIQSGQRTLHERINKLFDWCDEVLKHEDIEAVHKMRVASRRLRATLDAYEPCCNPKQFKKAYRRIKKLADLLGSARDSDVILQGLHTQLAEAPTAEHPGIQWLIQRLHAYRQQKQQALEDFFASLDEEGFKHQIKDCIDNP